MALGDELVRELSMMVVQCVHTYTRTHPAQWQMTYWNNFRAVCGCYDNQCSLGFHLAMWQRLWRQLEAEPVAEPAQSKACENLVDAGAAATAAAASTSTSRGCRAWTAKPRTSTLGGNLFTLHTERSPFPTAPCGFLQFVFVSNSCAGGEGAACFQLWISWKVLGIWAQCEFLFGEVS